ncbi:MAG: hypothetical protein VB876_04055, partial [Pirellulales bacterium]
LSAGDKSARSNYPANWPDDQFSRAALAAFEVYSRHRDLIVGGWHWMIQGEELPLRGQVVVDMIEIVGSVDDR